MSDGFAKSGGVFWSDTHIFVNIAPIFGGVFDDIATQGFGNASFLGFSCGVSVL